MKQADDKLVKQKMGSLDTLSGGIVFGKEEAWEKLQVRIEAKSVKRIPLKYWMAAAALLLLFVCVMTIYKYPVKEVVKVKQGEQEKVNNVAISKPEYVPVQHQEAIQMNSSTPVATEYHHEVIAPEKAQPTLQQETTSIKIVQAPVNENKTDLPVATNSTVPEPLAKTMKVLHINELDEKNIRELTPAIVVNYVPGLDMKKLPVVNINDVVTEEYEVQRILKENRLSIGHISLGNPVRNSEYKTTETTDDQQLFHSFKIRLTLKN
jgi:hypothetical protein